MLTPQQVQEVTFTKAVFGGYDMKSVDDFLDQLSADYINLTQENSNLKSKLRVLVQKLEEYRDKEQQLNQASIQAAAIVADAERKAAQIAQAAPEAAPAEAAPSEAAPVQPAPAPVQPQVDVTAALAAEEQRVENARRVAQNFIAAVEESVGKHMALLDELKKLEAPAEKKQAPYDFDAEADPTPEPAPAAEDDTDMKIAIDPVAEIARNIERFYAEDEDVDSDATKVVTMPKANTKKFTDLQFGPGYDPRG